MERGTPKTEPADKDRKLIIKNKIFNRKNNLEWVKGGGGGGWQPKKTKSYLTFMILGLVFFFFFFFGLLLGKFWHHFNESRLLFL